MLQLLWRTSQDNDSSECVQEGRFKTSQTGEDGGILQIKLLLVEPTLIELLFIARVDPDDPAHSAQVFCTGIIYLLYGEIIYGLWAICFHAACLQPQPGQQL